jgi:O-antigen ligase
MTFMNQIRQKAKSAASPLLIIFAFALPLSTSAGSILAILLILTWFLSGDLKEKLKVIFHNPVTIAVLLYILLHIIGLLWTQELDWGLHILKKQWKLLLFPILLTLVRKDHTKYYLSAFVAAISIKACKAYLVWLGIITLPPGSTFTTLGTSHVIYNPMLALAIYIVGQNLLFGKNRPLVMWLKIGLTIFLSCNMFITAGRAGHAAFFVLLIVTLFQYLYPRSKKILFVCLFLLPFLVISIFQCSPTFKDRINTAITEIQNSDSMKITSMGCRFWFYKNTSLLLKKNWLVGTGTGDFPVEYAKINKIYSPAMPNTDNPHNQYLLVTSQFGIVGLISLIAIFLIQLNLAFKKRDLLTPLRQAFPIFFLAIMMAESYLQVYETGFLFSLFSAFLYRIEV